MSSAADILALLDKHQPDVTKSRVGLSAERVRQLTASARPVSMPTPQEARVALARMARSAHRGTWGRRGMPEHVWRAMYAEYRAGKSCTEVAKIFGGTRQSVHEVFKVRKLKLRPRHLMLHSQFVFDGVAYTPGKDGYYRATTGDRRPLHHVMWEAARGPIPEGWQVTFLNADHTDLRIENMECLPIADVARLHNARHKKEAA